MENESTFPPGRPVQLRIGFSSPNKPQTLYLQLSGLLVLVEPDDANYDLAAEYLVAAGIPATIDPGKGLHFPVKHLSSLSSLPNQVFLSADRLLAPLVELVQNPSADNLPATLILDPSGSLQISWFDGSLNHEEDFMPEASAALLNAEIPFVATSETWDALKEHCRLPLLAGRARVNLDGFIEISATKPQLVETSPLPALFKLDDTHFGMPLDHASSLDRDHSFAWEGHRPSLESSFSLPSSLPESILKRSEDLKDVLHSLSAQRAAVLAWDSGLGRRVFALAAVESLDAFPLLIVTSPSSLWAWERHLDLFGRTYALSHDRSDVHIITYRDLAARPVLSSPSAIIFDRLSKAVEHLPETTSALHKLDGLLDAYRIACEDSFPSKPDDAIHVMSILRPGEFRSDVPIVQRYPINPSQRAQEHIDAYMVRRGNGLEKSAKFDFKRSTVLALQPTEAQEVAFEQALSRPRDPADMLAEMLSITSSGPAHATSPKVVAAAAQAQRAAQERRPIVLLTRHQRTSQLLKAMLRPLPVVCAEPGEPISPSSPITVLRYDSDLPSLKAFQDVVVIDYPWSSDILERAIGSAQEQSWPQKVTCLHLENTIDDRVAVLAARRRERSAVLDGTAPPSAEELAYLLVPRL